MTQQGSRILVLGLGLSGLEAAMLARRQGAEVSVLDSAETAQLEARAATLKTSGCQVFLSWNQEAWEQAVDYCIISPGIAPESLLGRLAEGLNCPVIGEIEYAFEYIQCPILAVTGTNGKTTTVELLAHILQSCGMQVAKAGNIGQPLAKLTEVSASLDYIVAEVSSFQLERTLRFAPLGAACLNVTSDHMDRYPDFSGYLEAKLNIFSNVPSARQAVINQALWELPQVRQCFTNRKPVSFASEAGSDADYWIENDGLQDRENGQLIQLSETKLRGQHNLENMAAALALCRMIQVPLEDCLKAMRSFAPGAHRLEEVLVHGGITYVNDSKATNPDALIRALETCGKGITGQIILIAGGRDKGMDFSLVLPVLKRYAKAVYLIGETSHQLKEVWQAHLPCQTQVSMADAVQSAIESAEKGDLILLSPGCASQDMYNDYAERGNHFSNTLKRRLKNEIKENPDT